jgi:hypothetical protein
MDLQIRRMIYMFRNWVLQNFPFLENDFDALTDYELFCKMVGYVKELDYFVKNELDNAIEDYIIKNFNNIMIDAMYDEPTETLILYKEENNG